MLQISLCVNLLRGVLCNGVLYFLRDPGDPNYNPFRDLIDDPVHKHARRVLLSITIYGSLVVMLVFFPVKFAMQMLPSVFPLDTPVSDHSLRSVLTCFSFKFASHLLLSTLSAPWEATKRKTREEKEEKAFVVLMPHGYGQRCLWMRLDHGILMFLWTLWFLHYYLCFKHIPENDLATRLMGDQTLKI